MPPDSLLCSPLSAHNWHSKAAGGKRGSMVTGKMEPQGPAQALDALFSDRSCLVHSWGLPLPTSTPALAGRRDTLVVSFNHPSGWGWGQ